MLVNCAAYEDGRKVADIGTQDISDYLERPGCFVWVALRDAQPDELAVMQEEFGLHPLAVEDAHHGHQRPKIEEYGDCLFVVLHMVELQDEEVAVSEVHIFAGPNYVLSVRQNTQRGFSAVRSRTEREPELLRQGAGFVLYAIMDHVVDGYFPVVDALEDELDKIEARIFASKDHRSNIEDLYDLKGRIMVVRHAIEPLIEAIHKLHGGRVPVVCANTQEYYRDVTDHLLRVSQQLEHVREMVVTAMSVNLSLVSMSASEVTKRLASYAALIGVPTLIAAIYGMNFQHMPELAWPMGYPVVVGVMAVADVLLFLRFRKVGWL